MQIYNYKEDILHIEEVALTKIALQYGTPVYCYSKKAFKDSYKTIENSLKKHIPEADILIAYAVKASSNIAIIKLLSDMGAGADIVSEGELFRTEKAGIQSKNIVFSGVGKTDIEIKKAIEKEICQINIESKEELANIAKIAQNLGKEAKIALRVNPDIDANTHDKIATGRKGDKFGIDIDEAIAIYKQANSMSGIKIVGVAIHIGSQIAKIEPFRRAFIKIADLVHRLKEEGIKLKNIDIGGGFGITYSSEKAIDFDELAIVIKELIAPLSCKIILEPGRFIAGNSGIVLTKLLYAKHTKHKNFLIIDAAMNDLARPSIYGAYHPILPVKKASDLQLKTYEIVGPVCETGDIFARNEQMPAPKHGDLFAIMVSGAYGASMASNYNSRPFLPEVMVDGKEHFLIRKRQSFFDMLAQEEF